MRFYDVFRPLKMDHSGSGEQSKKVINILITKRFFKCVIKRVILFSVPL